MSNTNETPNFETSPTYNDPLSGSAGDIDTSFPVLPVGLYRMTIAKAEKVAVKECSDLDDNDPTKRWMCKITLKTTTTTKSTSGEDIPEGFTVTTRVSLTPNGDMTIAKVKKNVAAVLQAVFGSKTTEPMSTLRDNPSSLEDKVVDIKLKLSKPNDAFPNLSNEVASWIPLRN